VLFAALAVAACGRPDGPNLLLVTLDTVRVDHVGAYGGPADATPHLDALARGGLVHDAAYTTMPTTGPAHLSLFTGRLPSEHGGVRNGMPLAATERPRSLPVLLRQRGWSTGAFVTTALLDPRATGLAGFAAFDAPLPTTPLRPGDEAVEAALAWLDRAAEPVFLWVHLYDPHAPYGAPDEKRAQLPLDPDAFGFVDPARYADALARERMARDYRAGVRAADDALGRLLAGARARLAREALVVVASDHGEALDELLATRGYAYDHGEFLDPDQTRIVLVLAGPGVEPGRSPAAASIRDLYTTLLQAAGLHDPTAAAEGRRDLRRASNAARSVVVERRPLAEPGRDEVPPERFELVGGHAVAVTDGRALAIVGEDGRATVERGAEAAALAASARAVVATRAAAGDGRAAPPLDPALAEALRSLGYAR
jgi:choline-sulfatase